MKSAVGFLAYLFVVYGPMPCRDPYTKFGVWCLSHSGDWVYRKERHEFEKIN